MFNTDRIPYQSLSLNFAPLPIKRFIGSMEYEFADLDAKPEINEKGEYVFNSLFLESRFLWAYNIPFVAQQKTDAWIDIEQYLKNPTDGYEKFFNYLKRAYDTPYLVICPIDFSNWVNPTCIYEYVILPLYKEGEHLSSNEGSLYITPQPLYFDEEYMESQFPNQCKIFYEKRHQFKIRIKQSEYQQGQTVIAEEFGVCEDDDDDLKEINCFML